MRKSIQAFDIFLEPHDQWIFYKREGGILTSASDLKHPYPAFVSAIWHQKDHSWEKTNVGRNAPDKVVVPSCGVKEGELSAFFEEHALRCMEDAMKNIENDFNIFLPRRKINDNLIQVGIFVRDAIGETHNTGVEAHLNRMLQLKVFW